MGNFRLNMFPAFAQLDARHCGLSYAITHSNCALRNSLRKHCSDVLYIFFRQFYRGVCFAFHAFLQSQYICVALVLGLRDVFKIVRTIVYLDTILVIENASLGPWPKKRLSDGGVNFDIEALSWANRIVETASHIAAPNFLRLQNISGWYIAFVNSPSKSPKIAGFIIGKTRNKFPNLFNVGRMVISHDAFLLFRKVLWSGSQRCVNTGAGRFCLCGHSIINSNGVAHA